MDGVAGFLADSAVCKGFDEAEVAEIAARPLFHQEWEGADQS